MAGTQTEDQHSQVPLGKLSNVPELPPHFLPRPEELQPLKEKVLVETNQTIDEKILIALERGIKSQPFDRDPNLRQGVYRSAPRVNWSIILGIVGLLVILIVAFKFLQDATQPQQPVQSTPTPQPTFTCKDYDATGKWCPNRNNDCRECFATP